MEPINNLPVSLSKIDDPIYYQKQYEYDQQQLLLFQQQQMIIQQQQQQLESQQRNYQDLQIAQQKLEEQQLLVQQLQYEKALLESNQIKVQLEKQQNSLPEMDQEQLFDFQKKAYQQQQPTQNTPSTISNIDPTAEPVEVVKGCLNTPPFSVFIGEARGRIRVRVIKGNNLMACDLNGKSDPYVKIKSSCFNYYPQTRVIDKNLNPEWNEEFYLTIENVRTELLMFKVYDHDLIGNDDLMGYIGVPLSLLPIGVEMVTTEKLNFAKHGTITIGITALDFGLTNIPSNYISTYIGWRTELKGMQKREFSLLPNLKKNKFISNVELGPYYCKIASPDFKIVHGYVKMRKTSRSKFANGLETAGLITLTVLGAIIISPFYLAYLVLKTNK